MKIKIEKFKPLKDRDIVLEWKNKVAFLLGPNGMGKTTIVQMIYTGKPILCDGFSIEDVDTNDILLYDGLDKRDNLDDLLQYITPDLIKYLNYYMEEKEFKYVKDHWEIWQGGRRLSSISSGESCLIEIFIKASRCKGLFLLDLPETHIHLAWQRHLLDTLEEISSAQLLIVTHAPSILGSHAKEENIINLYDLWK